METLIILAFVLFIVGVGSTILYDKYKDDLKNKFKQVVVQRNNVVRGDMSRKDINKSSRTPFQDAHNEILRQRKEVEDTIKQIRAQFEQAKKKPTKRKVSRKTLVKRPKPGSYNFGQVHANQLPTETQYDTYTVQDLIDMMEGRKPKPSRSGDQDWIGQFLDTLDIED